MSLEISQLEQKLVAQLEMIDGVLDRSRVEYRGPQLLPADVSLFERWIDKTRAALRYELGTHEEGRFIEVASERFDYHHKSPHARAQRAREHIAGLLRIAKEFPTQLTYTDPALSRISKPAATPTKVGSSVFVIHGRDELNVLRLQKMLMDEFGIVGIVLADQPGKSRTIIEKFEQEAVKAGYAFALLTPDDFVQSPGGDYAQARPNAVFELGWFSGRLGRDRTCIVLKKGTHVHSDLDGINRIEFAESVSECVPEIKRELKAAGMVKPNPK